MSLKTIMSPVFEEWLQAEGISRGSFKNSLDTLLTRFLSFADRQGKAIPISRGVMACLLSQRFYKQQIRPKSGKSVQCYFINQNLEGIKS